MEIAQGGITVVASTMRQTQIEALAPIQGGLALRFAETRCVGTILSGSGTVESSRVCCSLSPTRAETAILDPRRPSPCN